MLILSSKWNVEYERMKTRNDKKSPKAQINDMKREREKERDLLNTTFGTFSALYVIFESNYFYEALKNVRISWVSYDHAYGQYTSIYYLLEYPSQNFEFHYQRELQFINAMSKIFAIKMQVQFNISKIYIPRCIVITITSIVLCVVRHNNLCLYQTLMHSRENNELIGFWLWLWLCWAKSIISPNLAVVCMYLCAQMLKYPMALSKKRKMIKWMEATFVLEPQKVMRSYIQNANTKQRNGDSKTHTHTYKCIPHNKQNWKDIALYLVCQIVTTSPLSLHVYTIPHIVVVPYMYMHQSIRMQVLKCQCHIIFQCSKGKCTQEYTSKTIVNIQHFAVVMHPNHFVIIFVFHLSFKWLYVCVFI